MQIAEHYTDGEWLPAGVLEQSGLGRLHGVEGLNDFLETKHVHLEMGTV